MMAKIEIIGSETKHISCINSVIYFLFFVVFFSGWKHSHERVMGLSKVKSLIQTHLFHILFLFFLFFFCLSSG